MRTNKELFEESKKYLCGGVNSPVRAIKPYPFYRKGQRGNAIRRLKEKVTSILLMLGPMMLGHKNPENY